MDKRERSPTDMVLVMVVTGAGKSYFVNKLKEGAIVEGSDMDALRTFQELVGEAAFLHVVFVSTM